MRFRDLYSDDFRLCILPPKDHCAACGRKCIYNSEDYDARLARIRRLRGKVFLADGAVTQEHLDESGSYHTSLDHRAWHIYLAGNDGEVPACCTLMLHRNVVEVQELRISELLCHIQDDRRGLYESAIQSLIREAARLNVGFGEAAAWAIDQKFRNHCASMMMIIASWPLYQTLGNAIIIGAPTSRHHTSSIEKRMGGFPLALQGSPLGPFHDAPHGCDMEFVWFDSQRPLSRFAQIISEMRSHFEKLQTCPCRNEPAEVHKTRKCESNSCDRS